jgi:hypothetical protein
VRQGPGIDNDPINAIFCCVQPINQRMLCVGLKKAQLNLIGIALTQEGIFNVLQALRAIHLGFAGPQQIQVRTIHHQNLLLHLLLASAAYRNLKLN